MMKKTLLFYLFLFFVSAQAFATTYYVSQSPAGYGDGSSCANAKSLSWFNSNATAGDTAYMCEGVFSTSPQPSNSGTSGSYITYQRDPAAAEFSAVIKKSGYGALIKFKNYIKYDGLYFNGTTSRWMELEGTQYIIIQNCRFYNANSYQGLRVANSQYWKILNNDFPDAPIRSGWTTDRWGADCQSAFEARTALPSFCDWHTAPSDMIRIGTGGNKGIIEGNTLGSVSHNSIMVYKGEDVVVRNNTVENVLHSAINFASEYANGYTSRSLFEGNTINNAGVNWDSCPVRASRSPGWRSNGIQTTALVTNRNNIFNSGITGIGLSGNDTSAQRKASNSRIYHNTVYDMLYGQSLYMNNSVEVTNIKTVNNIFYNVSNQVVNGFPTRSISNVTDVGTPINYWMNNLWTPNAANFHFKNTSSKSKTLTQVKTLYPTEWYASNISGNPKFVNAASGDFRLGAGSPAISSGAFLATISGKTGNVITVDDSLFFYDGWSIPGETGDTIYNDSGQSAIIKSINYNKHQITLDSTMNFKTGDKITTVRFYGTSPDIGARQFDNGQVGVNPGSTLHKPKNIMVFPSTQ